MKRKHAARSSRCSIPVYREVYQRIRSEILSGRLAAGARLPSSRTLAAELGIARGTVVTAFQMLAGEGYTLSAGARGTVVNVALPRVRKLRPTAEPGGNWWTITELLARRQHRSSFRLACRPWTCSRASYGRKSSCGWRVSSITSRWSIPTGTVAWVTSPAARNCELFADCAGYHMFR